MTYSDPESAERAEAEALILASGITPHAIYWEGTAEPQYGERLILLDASDDASDELATALERDHGFTIGSPEDWVECSTCNLPVRTTPSHSRWRYSYDYPCDGEIACHHCLERFPHLRAGVIELAFERNHEIGHLIDPEREGMACLFTGEHASYSGITPAKIGAALESAGLDRWAYSIDSFRGYTRFKVWSYPIDLDGIRVSRTLDIPGLSEGIAKAMLQLATA